MSQWWICPTNNIVCINDAPIGIDLASMPQNIHLVFWYGEDGEILYNDRLAAREKITDLTPYIPVFDQWMIVAQGEEPPITLEQAQTVKTAMVDSLFHFWRQVPLDFGGGAVFEATDLRVDAMSREINAATQSNIDQINAIVAGEQTTPVVGPDIYWTTIDGTEILFAFSDFVSLHNTVHYRQEVLDFIKHYYTEQIAMLTTIEDVAAYIITEGWEDPLGITPSRDWRKQLSERWKNGVAVRDQSGALAQAIARSKLQGRTVPRRAAGKN